MSITKLYTVFPLCMLLLLAINVESKCSVRKPYGFASPQQHGDAGFQLSINEQPEFYEERNLYTITLKVTLFYSNYLRNLIGR